MAEVVVVMLTDVLDQFEHVENVEDTLGFLVARLTGVLNYVNVGHVQGMAAVPLFVTLMIVINFLKKMENVLGMKRVNVVSTTDVMRMHLQVGNAVDMAGVVVVRLTDALH